MKSTHAVPQSVIVFWLSLAIALFSYGTYGFIVGSLYIPGRGSPGLTLQGTPATIAYCACLLVCASMLLLVLRHFVGVSTARALRIVTPILAWAGGLTYLAALWVVLHEA